MFVSNVCSVCNSRNAGILDFHANAIPQGKKCKSVHVSQGRCVLKAYQLSEVSYFSLFNHLFVFMCVWDGEGGVKNQYN